MSHTNITTRTLKKKLYLGVLKRSVDVDELSFCRKHLNGVILRALPANAPVTTLIRVMFLQCYINVHFGTFPKGNRSSVSLTFEQ